jgi:hypothetical protein
MDPPGLAKRSEARRGRRPRDIGTEAETAVVRYLRDNGFPHAERRALYGALDQGDITGTPGVAWEIKGGKAAKSPGPALVDSWLAQTEAERCNARASVGVLVMARAGYGAARCGMWWAVLPLHVVTLPQCLPLGDRSHVWAPLGDVVRWLRHWGHGEPL